MDLERGRPEVLLVFYQCGSGGAHSTSLTLHYIEVIQDWDSHCRSVNSGVGSGPCLFMSRFKKSIAAEDADVRGCAQFAGVKVYMGLTSRAVDLNQSHAGERRLFSRPVYHA